MGNVFPDLLNGIVIETDVESYIGEYLYSDFATGKGEKDSTLNSLAQTFVVGIVAGIARVALGIVHVLYHLFAALFTLKKGHLFHASKGACEILRGIIEAIPIIGRIFANSYNYAEEYETWQYKGRSWWMIKIYNPNKPDGLDKWMDNWHNFRHYCPENFYANE